MSEIRPVVGNPRWTISDEGQAWGPQGPLKLCVRRGGYIRVAVNDQWRDVHKLVLEAFVGPKPPGLQIRHLNGNPADNRLENLAYGTAAENAEDRRRHGTHHNTRKTHCPSGHEYTPENTYLRTERGHRYCRACGNAQSRRRYLAKKAAAKAATS